MSAINFITAPPGLPVSWTNTNTSIGLAASGSGDIPAYSPIINGGAIQTGTITATTGCSPTTFSISVVPGVSINSISNQTLCSGSISNPIIISTNSPAYSINWANSNTNIGLGTSGTGNIPAFTVSSTPTTSTITVIATNGMCGNGDTINFTTSNIASPIIITSSDDTICSGSSVLLSAPGIVAANDTASFENLNDFAIPDNNTTGVTSSISVSGYTGNVSSAQLSVKLNILHTWDEDLDIFLQSPDGTMIELSTDNGGNGNNYTNTIFSTNGTTSIPLGVAPFTGTFIPEQSFSLFSTSNINGIWNLILKDDVSADIGTLKDWTITFVTQRDYSWWPSFNLSSSTGDTVTAFPNASTIYTVSLSNPGGCASTGTVSIYVDSNSPSAPTVQDLSICYNDSTAVLSATANSGGTLYWYTTPTGGIGDTLAPDLSSLTQGTTTTYYVSEGAACGEGPRSDINVNITGPQNIDFWVSDPLGNYWVMTGKAYLFAHSASNIAFDTIAVSNFTNANIHFTSIVPGAYIVKCIPDNAAYPNLMNSYSVYLGVNTLWQSAELINHICDAPYSNTMELAEFQTATGPGFISGTVVEGTGFGSKLIAGSSATQAIGDPIKNVDVNLIDTTSNLVVAQSTSDINGYYEFTNVAVGDYTLQVDIPGLIMDSSYSIQITPIVAMSAGTSSIMSTSYTNLGFIADDNSIFPTTTIGINELKNRTQEISIFPNPAKNVVTIRTNGFDTKGYEVEVLNAQGLTVFKGENASTSDYTLDLKKLNIASGLYVIKLSSGNVIKTAKLIVE